MSMLDSFGGSRYLWYYLWTRQKAWEVFLRTHLSHTLALVLGILVIIREADQIGSVLGRFLLPDWAFLALALLWAALVIRYGVLLLRQRGRLHLLRHIIFLIPIVVSLLGIIYVLKAAQNLPSLAEWLIVMIVIGTIATATWEFRGDKLTTSPQEIRFVHGVRSLLYCPASAGNGGSVHPLR